MCSLFAAIFIGLISSGFPRPQDPSAYFGKYSFGAPVKFGIKGGVKGGSFPWEPSKPDWFFRTSSTDGTSTTDEIVITSPRGYLVTSSELASSEAFTTFPSGDYSVSLLPRKVPSDGSSISTSPEGVEEGIMKAVGSGEVGHHVQNGASEELGILGSTEIPEQDKVSKPLLQVEGVVSSTEGVKVNGESVPTLTTQRLPITTEDQPTTFTPEKPSQTSFPSSSEAYLTPIKKESLQGGPTNPPAEKVTPMVVDIPTYIVSKAQSQNETTSESPVEGATKATAMEQPISSTVISELCGASCERSPKPSSAPALTIPYYEPKNVTDELIEKVKKLIEEKSESQDSDSTSVNLGEDLPSDQEMMDLLTDRNLGEEEVQKLLRGEQQQTLPVLKEQEKLSSGAPQEPDKEDMQDQVKEIVIMTPEMIESLVESQEQEKLKVSLPDATEKEPETLKPTTDAPSSKEEPLEVPTTQIPESKEDPNKPESLEETTTSTTAEDNLSTSLPNSEEKDKVPASSETVEEQQKMEPIFGQEKEIVQLPSIPNGQISLEDQQKIIVNLMVPDQFLPVSPEGPTSAKNNEEQTTIAQATEDSVRNSREQSMEQEVVVIPVEQGQIKISPIDQDSKPPRPKYSLIPQDKKESDALPVPEKVDDEESYFSMEQGEIREVSSEEFKTTPPIVRVVTEVSVESMKSSEEKVIESSPQQVESNKKSEGALTKAGKIISDAFTKSWAAVTGLFNR